jgi:hypothetical protein
MRQKPTPAVTDYLKFLDSNPLWRMMNRDVVTDDEDDDYDDHVRTETAFLRREQL